MSEKNELSLRLQRQISFIYDTLIKLGYHKFVAANITQDSLQKESYLAAYFQSTPDREELIEWLISRACPAYAEDIDYKAQTTTTKKLMSALWKVGAMPLSKHTKHLDYEKYTLGLLGHQNAVSLIHNLCELAIQCRNHKKSKEDGNFQEFMAQVYDNYDSLVNPDYDPYGIAWPQKFKELDEYQFIEQYKEFRDQFTKMESDVHHPNDEHHPKEKKKGLGSQLMFKGLEQHKQRFMKKYDQLINKVRDVDAKYKNALDVWTKDESMQGKSIHVSSLLPAKYRQYKRTIQLPAYQPGQLDINKQTVRSIIHSLNQSPLGTH